MTVEEYEKAGKLVEMIKSCELIIKDFDNHLNVIFEIKAISSDRTLDFITLTDSGAQMLYNAINYTKNTLIRELENI